MLILLLTGGLQYGINLLVIRCNQKAGYRLRTHLYAKLLRIRVHYYDQSATGDILARSDNDLITTINGFTLFFNQLVLNIFTMVILIVTMFLVSFYLALVVSIITPITLFISLLFLFQLKKYIKQRQHNLSILNGFLEETISGLKEIKIFHQETSFETTFIQLNQKYVRSAYQADFWFAFFIPFNTFFNNLINIIIVALGIVIITGIGHNNGNFLGIFSTNLFSQYQKNGNNFSNDTY